MVEPIKSWVKENSTLVYFLIGQAIILGGGAASALAYFTKLETRVTIMEERGAAYTVARMDELKLKIAVLEQQIKKNEESIQRIINEYLKDRQK